MKRILLSIVLALSFIGLTCKVSAQPVMEIGQYAPIRIQFPIKSPFNVTGADPNPILPLPYMPSPPSVYNGDPSEWSVYKATESYDFTVYTKNVSTGQFIYYSRTVLQYSLGLGFKKDTYHVVNQQIVHDFSSGYKPTQDDASWSSGEIADELTWDSSYEYNNFTSGGTQFNNLRSVQVQWKLCNKYPNLMYQDAEVILKWSGTTWPYSAFYEVSSPSPYYRWRFLIYPVGLPWIYISNPQSPNTKVSGYPACEGSSAPVRLN